MSSPTAVACDVACPYPTPRVEDLSDAWREARAESACAYEAWRAASMNRRRMAYAVYVAAADREAAAERTFLRAVARV